MAEQVITIRTKTEVAALDRLQQKLEAQIAVARATGKAYDHLERELLQVRAAMDKIPAFDRMKAGLQNGSPLQLIGGARSWIAGAGAALTAGQARETLQMADALGTLRDATGASVEMLQTFREAAIQTGNSSQMADKAVDKLNIRFGEAAAGNKEAIQIFKDLNVTLADTDGRLRATDDLLRDTADRFKAIEDPAERARIAKKLFGDENAKLAVTLALGSDGLERMRGELEKMNRLLTDEEIRNLDEYDKKLKTLSATLDSMSAKAFNWLGNQAEQAGAFWGAAFSGSRANAIDWGAGEDAVTKRLLDNGKDLAQVTRERAEAQKQIVKAAQDEAAAKQSALSADRESSQLRKMAMEDLKQNQAANDASEFQSVDEVIAAADDPRATPGIKRDAAIGRRVKQLRAAAEKERGFNPERSRLLSERADQTEQYIDSLASNRKRLGDRPQVQQNWYDSEVATAMAETSKRAADAQKKANEETVKAMQAGVENAQQTAAKMGILADQVVDLMRRMRNMEIKDKTRI